MIRVLDATGDPTDITKKELLIAQIKFAHSVFEDYFLRHKENSAARSYENDYYVQTAYSELCIYCIDSVKDSITEYGVLSYRTRR